MRDVASSAGQSASGYGEPASAAEIAQEKALPQKTISMLAEMDTALADEIKKQSQRSGYSRRARHGKLSSESGGHYIYDFTLDEPWEADDDAQVRIEFPGSSNIKATIVSAAGTALTIATDEPLPPEALDGITMVDDPTALLERLREALSKNAEGVSQLASKTFGFLPFQSARRPLADDYPDFTPNGSQSDAIRLCLSSEVAYIIGPPGTGKTVALAAIAYSMAREGRSVLIAAQTNIAVDNAILKLADMGKSGKLPAWQDGRMIRYGVPQIKRIRDRDDIYPPKMSKRIGQDFESQRVALVQSRDAALDRLRVVNEHLAEQTKAWDEARQTLIARRDLADRELTTLRRNEAQRVGHIDTDLQRLAQLRTQCEQSYGIAHRDLSHLVARQSQIEQSRTSHLAQANELAARLAAAQRMSRIVRLIRGVNLKRLAQRLADEKQAVQRDDRALEDTERLLEPAHERLATAQGELERVQAQHAHLTESRRTSPDIVQRDAALRVEITTCGQILSSGGHEQETKRSAIQIEQDSINNDVKRLVGQIAELDDKLRDLERRLLDEALVVATTLSKVYMNSGLRERQFDCVILDEVSMASLPSVYFATSRAESAVVVIGDPYQLPPIATAETPLARNWLKRDLFNVAEISLEQSVKGDPRGVLLDEQRRMHPAISVIARKHVYGGLLKDGEQKRDEKYSNVAPFPDSRLVLCDTSDGSPVTSRPGGSSRINFYHALCALAAARLLLSTLPPIPADPDNPFRIGIATPYKKQANLIQRMVKADGLDKQVRVATVHRFQGLEFEAVIFDTVEAPGIPPATAFIGGGRRSSGDGPRLINVAVTRPQHKLVVIADAPYINAQFEEDDTLRLAVDEAGQAGAIMSRELLGTFGERLTPERHESSVAPLVISTAMTMPLDLQVFDENTFFQRFFEDVRAAVSKITIFGPFVRWGRTSTMIGELVEAIKRGVQVSAVASEEPGGKSDRAPVDSSARSALEHAGVAFRTSPGMHEKLVFVDDTIVYWGSLNPLSHSGTTEFMARLVSPQIAQAIGKIVNVAVRADPAKWGMDCKISFSDLPTNGGNCPRCGGALLLKWGQYGSYYRCSGYSSGNHTQNVTDQQLSQIGTLTSLQCDECRAGLMRPRAERKDMWLECAAARPCGHRRKIVIIKT